MLYIIYNMYINILFIIDVISYIIMYDIIKNNYVREK